MPFEEFDKKIREAADHHHPAYDEYAWKKMEKLLNKHLPQPKDDRRRFLFLILLFLLIGGGVAVLISGPWKDYNRVATLDHPNTINGKPVSPANQPGDQPPVMGLKEEITYDNKEKPASIQVTGTGNHTGTPVFNPATLNNNKPAEANVLPLTFAGNKQADDKLNGEKLSAAENTPVSKTMTSDSEVQNSIKKDAEEKKILNPEIEKQITSIDAIAKTNKTKKKNSSFFLSASLAPDVSSTDWNSPGKLKLLGGAGIGYRFDKLTLRTGFYSGRKVYSAEAAEYNPPASFWNYYTNLDRVDADCKVYEIPLHLSYHFGSSTKQNWFAGAGISSFLMKKESYTYHYKDNSGQPATRNWTIRDENNHYFSVLTLSGGYQRNINKRVSIMAEPYVKLPLAGVGYGKVKLNSAGVMLSATMRPFGKQ